MKIDRNNSFYWNNKGIALQAQEKYDDAIKAYDEAIRLDKNSFRAWDNKGIALQAQGRYDEAIKAYDEAIRLDKNYSSAWNNKARPCAEGYDDVKALMRLK